MCAKAWQSWASIRSAAARRSSARASRATSRNGPRSRAPRTSGTTSVSQRVARDPQAGRAHVVAAQLAQRVADEIGADFLAPVKNEGGIVHRLRARGHQPARLLDHFVGQLFAFQKYIRPVDDIATQRLLAVATQQTAPSFFRQKSIALRHS